MKTTFKKLCASVAILGFLTVLPPQAAQATITSSSIAPVSANQTFTRGALTPVQFDGTVLSGFTGTVEVRVSVQSGAGLLHVTSATGMTLIGGYSDAVAGNVAALGYSGSQANANAMLATLQYIGDSAAGADNIRIAVTNQLAAGSYPVFGGHAYRLVNTPNITWDAARTAAAALSIPRVGGGTCPGYLATINGNGVETSLKGRLERAFLNANVPTAVYTWIGASNAAVRGTWQWVTDPDDPTSVFWSGFGDGSRQNGFDANWYPGEPNNSGGIELYAQITFGLDTWNDSSAVANSYNYYVEYGSSTCQPQVVADNEAVSIASLNTISEPAALSALTAQRDGNSARLSWATPANGGSAITDYAVAYQQNGASTWTPLSHSASTATSAQIPGIDPNVAYNFRVAAINGIGQASWTSSSLEVPRPWTGPAIGIQPSRTSRQVPNTGGTLELTGSGFDKTTAVLLNGVNLKFDATAANLIKIHIPAGTGSPDLSFSSTEGGLIYQNAFEYVAPKQVLVSKSLSFSGKAWTSKSSTTILKNLKSQTGYRSVTCRILVGTSNYRSLKAFCLKLQSEYVFANLKVVDARTIKAGKSESYRIQFVVSE